jgi:hypothetical protein
MDLGAPKTVLEGDATRLQQVMWNIVGNAVKFSDPGGRIHISTANPAQDTLEITIEDHGIGISKETVQRLFRPFEQASYHEGRMFGGLGLGMAISKRLLDHHNGTISVHSEGRGTGATFVVRLPVMESTSIPARPASIPLLKAQNVRKILLVEDHRDTAEALRTLLMKSGHSISLATSVQAALALLQNEQFDLLLSDLGLPDGTGLDLIRHLREFSNMPAIALSGHGMSQDVNACLHAGFDAHLTKPLSIQELRDKIQEIRLV